MVSRPTAAVTKPAIMDPQSGTMNRNRIYLLATRVEDRHGNWVTYSYTNGKLMQINAKDGRNITLTWSSDRVTSVAAAGKTWQYQYKATTASPWFNGPGLEKVTLPDGSFWQYSATGHLGQIETYQPSFESGTYTCPDFQRPEFYFNYSVKHPAGASSAFAFAGMRHYRSGVPWVCYNYPDTGYEELAAPNYADAATLTSKTVSGPGIPTKTWTYAYGEPNTSSFAYPPMTAGGAWWIPTPRDACVPGVPCAPEPHAKYVTQTESTGRVTRYTFGTGFETNDGRLLAEEVLSGGTVVRRTASVFITDAEVATQPFAGEIGTNRLAWQPLSTLVRPVRETVISQQGVTFESYTHDFDPQARPSRVRERSREAGETRDTRTALLDYHDYLPSWTVGQPLAKRYEERPEIIYSLSYHPTMALPTQLYKFGLLTDTYTYRPDGTLASVRDGRNYTTTLNNWYRGVPRTVTFPDLTSVSATVNSYGSITSVTDELGSTTSYGHDAMGRVSQITYPAGDTVAWAPTTVSFVPVAATEYGLPAGHWRQTTMRGNYRKETYFDGLWRPVFEREYDNAAVNATQRFTGRQYDMDGQVTFAGYPLTSATSVGSFTQGVSNNYDELGRLQMVLQSSELGELRTIYEYGAGFETAVSNPRQQITRTHFQAFDQPDTSAPVLIESPEGQSTAIARDLFGAPTVLNRLGVWNGKDLQLSRNYVYDVHRRLCKTVEPETGATVLGYDNAGNLDYSATGIASPDVTSQNACSQGYTAAIIAGRGVARTYDARNRLITLALPDGKGNQTWTYAADGLPNQVTTINQGNTSVVNTFTYNKRRQLTNETLAQPGWYNWALGYGYDVHGNLAGHTYPSGLTVTYAPNALGQATQAGSFASAVQYHRNGAIKQFTYGNGRIHTMTLNARLLPASSVDSGGVLSQQFGYDKNGNVTSVVDALDPARTKAMTYDGLDRLTSATATVFGGNGVHQFTYDPLDNLRSWKLGGVKDLAQYNYGLDNRLVDVRNTTGQIVHAFSYDVQGNISSRNSVPFEFDFGNRLRKVIGQESYRYDGLGRRVHGWRHSNGNVLSMYSQAGQVIWQYSDPLQRYTDHVYLGGSLVATREQPFGTGTEIVKYQHTDALGSPVAVTNQAGAVTERTNYDPYGGAINKLIDGVGYTGHVMDPVTGLVQMQQRYYDPAVGAFLSVDPVSALSNPVGYFNRYRYAANNPYRFTDPDGRCYTSTGECMTDEEFDQAWKGEAGRVLNAIGSPLGTAADMLNGDFKGAAINMVMSRIPGGKIATESAKITIKGFTGHAVDQAITRGVKPGQILDALRKPLKIGEVKVDDLGRPSQAIVGSKATVVVNPETGKVVTIYPTSTKRAEKLAEKRRKEEEAKR